MKRREFILGGLSAPVVITTPNLLMPVKLFEPKYPIKIWVKIDMPYVVSKDMMFKTSQRELMRLPNGVLVPHDAEWV